MTATGTDTDRVGRTRLTLVVTAMVLAAVDLTVKAWAVGDLADDRTLDLGLLDLKLTFNPGVAFSMGAGLPGWVILTVTGLITTGLAIFAWRVAATLPRPGALGLAAVLAGALANVADRASDGVVTDYLHTGWWPTFNLADVFITGGAALLILASLRGGRRHTDQPDGNTP